MSVCLRKGKRVPLSSNPKLKVQESQVRLEDCAVLPTEQVTWVHRTAEGLVRQNINANNDGWTLYANRNEALKEGEEDKERRRKNQDQQFLSVYHMQGTLNS